MKSLTMATEVLPAEDGEAEGAFSASKEANWSCSSPANATGVVIIARFLRIGGKRLTCSPTNDVARIGRK